VEIGCKGVDSVQPIDAIALIRRHSGVDIQCLKGWRDLLIEIARAGRLIGIGCYNVFHIGFLVGRRRAGTTLRF
jgi:hypothetical protein